MVQIWGLLNHFGHGNLPASDLAGLLSESGYKGDQLRVIMDKAAENRENPNDLKRHKSILGRTVAMTMEEQEGLRRIVPESTPAICCTGCVTCLFFTGFVTALGKPMLLILLPNCIIVYCTMFAADKRYLTSWLYFPIPGILVVGIIGSVWASTSWKGARAFLLAAHLLSATFSRSSSR